MARKNSANDSFRKQAKENDQKIDKIKTNLIRFDMSFDQLRVDALEDIYNILSYSGFERVEEEIDEISKEDKKLIRIEFYGTVDKPKDYIEDKNGKQAYANSISKMYSYAKNNPRGKFEVEDYNNLKDWPVWSVCSKSKKFRGIKNKVIDYLKENSIPPQILPNLSVYDFQDILYEAFVDEKGDRKAHIFEGKKYEFVKQIVKKHKKQLSEIFENSGVSQKNINKTLNIMARCGVADIYEQDKQGRLFEVTDFKLEVHHKKPVDTVDCKDNNIFDVNNFENLCLVINSRTFPLHRIIHLFDKKDKKSTLKQRLEVPENAIFIIGLEPMYMIKEDLSNNQVIKSLKQGAGRE